MRLYFLITIKTAILTKLSKLTLALILSGVASNSYASNLQPLQSQLTQLKQQIDKLESKLAEKKSQQVEQVSKQLQATSTDTAQQEKQSYGIKVGGAIRANYGISSYDEGNEDRGGDFDLGVVAKRKLKDNWTLDLGFFKNDELGGVDGSASDKNHRYSYDIIGSRPADEGTYAEPAKQLGEYNTFAGRATYQLKHSKNITTDLGVSLLSGGLHDGDDRAGNYSAWAVHLNSNINNWNIQFQHGEYDYDLDDGSNRFAVGAFDYYDSVSSQATMTNFNVAYDYALEWGPVTNLQFYNDYGIIYNKSDNSANTWMNVTGMSITAGGFFSYVDFVQARNQPFIGGTIIGDGDTERRFNINLGYYF